MARAEHMNTKREDHGWAKASFNKHKKKKKEKEIPNLIPGCTEFF